MALNFPNNPTTGQAFNNWIWDGVKWTTQSAVSGLGNVGRNLIHNSMFNIAQRGAGPFSTNSGYTLDRWMLQFTLDTVAIRQGLIADTDRVLIGDEIATFALNNQFTGNAGATAYNSIEHRVEKVQRLSGKNVIVSFWAIAGTNLKLGLNAYQIFGTGGSPSAAVQVLSTGASFNLTTGWSRYSVTVPIPSSAGKTFGTNGDDFTIFRIYFSSGANGNAVAGNVGVQSGAVSMWGVQLEIAQPGQTQPTPLEKINQQQDLANCQRFYQTGGWAAASSRADAATQASFASITFATTMRAAPTVSYYNTVFNNSSTIAVYVTAPSSFVLQTGASAAGLFFTTTNYTATADL